MLRGSLHSLAQNNKNNNNLKKRDHFNLPLKKGEEILDLICFSNYGPFIPAAALSNTHVVEASS